MSRETPHRALSPHHLLGALCAILLCAAVSGVGLLWSLFGPNPLALFSRSVTVPELLGSSYDTDPPGRPFSLTVEYCYDPSAPAGTVVGQSPRAGSTRRVAFWGSCPLTLTVSLGPERVAVPDCTGLSLRDATLLLRNLGFTVYTAQTVHESIAEGAIIGSQPAAGETPTRGSAVLLSVSAGDGIRRYTVPDLCGRTDSAARSLLTGAGLSVGRITYIRSDAVAGTVLEQSVPAGTTLTEENRTSVRLTVSGGPYYKVPQVPDLTGLTLEEAREALAQVGLTVGEIHRLSFLWNDGTVVTQSPHGGTYIASGLSQVDLYLAE